MHQKVTATVLEVDVARKRISLSLKKNPERAKQAEKKEKPKADMNALQQAFKKNRT